MFHEYAVDPECFCDWECFLTLEGKFGWDSGRLISAFPSNWIRCCFAALSEQQQPFRKKSKRIEEEIKRIKLSSLIRSNREYSGPSKEWLTIACNQHKIKPFSAIISTTEKKNERHVLLANNLGPNTSLWAVSRDLYVERNPEEIA